MSDQPGSDGTMRAWRLHQYGEPRDVLQLDTVPIPEPEKGEIRVRNEGIPMNLNDLERINGGNMMVVPELPTCPGMEVFGVVDACGAGAEAWQGKRIAATTKQAIGGYADFTICQTSSVFEMPDDLPFPDAAAVFFPFHLAWLGLFDRADLQAGESVLIHAAAGGSGSAAVQLAANAGARVFATAGTEEKLALCRELGADVTINYNEASFFDVVMAETQNRGVDVVFDNVGAAVFDDSLKATAYNGRYVMMGAASDKTKVDEPFVVPRRVIAGNMKLCGAILSYAQPEVVPFVKQAMGFNFATRDLGQKINDSVIELLRAKKVRTVIGQVCSFDQIPDAIDALASRKTVGRVIATV